MTPREEIIEFLQDFSTVYAAESETLGPGDDPAPMLALRVNDGDVIVASLPGYMLGGDHEKDLLFGGVFPQAIVGMDADMAAFASFSWHTIVPKEVRERVSARIEAEGVSRDDSATVRRMLEDEGMVLNDPERKGRVESCTVTVASTEAEAIVTAEVLRDGERGPRVDWTWTDVPEDENAPPWGVMLLPVGGEGGRSMSGRVIEGLREGLKRREAERARTGTDWRQE